MVLRQGKIIRNEDCGSQGRGDHPPGETRQVPGQLRPLLPPGDGGVQPARHRHRQDRAAVEPLLPEVRDQERGGGHGAQDLRALQHHELLHAGCRVRGPLGTDGGEGKCGDDCSEGFNTLSVSLQVGKISKQWSGVLKEAFTDADNFGISFPMDLDVKIKATLLGAVFLIDFMFFEETEND